MFTLKKLSLRYLVVMCGRQMWRYLGALTLGRLILWCYLIWYLVVVAHHFDANTRLWLTSLGLALIIGVALVLNAESGKTGARVDRWQRFRFVLAPFCVSSFAALVKGKGFILVFSPHWREVALGTVGCLGFVFLAWAARPTSSGRSMGTAVSGN